MNNPTEQPPPSQTAQIVRGVGALAGLVRRAAPEFRNGTNWREALVGVESLIGCMLETVGAVDAPAENSLASLMGSRGTASMVLQLTRLQARDAAKRLVLQVLLLELAGHPIRRGESVHASLRPMPGLLDAALSPANRRTAKRCLMRVANRLGLEGFRVDLVAMWRAGSPPIRCRRVQPVDPDPRDVVGFAFLAVLVIASDLWMLGRSPLDPLARGTIQETRRRWDATSPEFRRALPEALLLATDDRYTPDHLTKVVTEGVGATLEVDELDRAAGLLMGFLDLGGRVDESFTLFKFLGQIAYRADLLGDSETIAEHMDRLGRQARRRGGRKDWRVVELDKPRPGSLPCEVADETHDPQRSVPIWIDFDRAIVALSPGEQETFLRKLAGFPRAEIARRMGTSPDAVGVLQFRARKKLRESFGGGGRQKPRRRAS